MSDGLERLNLETEALKAQMGELDRLAQGFGARIASAFAGAALQGRNLSDVLRGLALSLSRMALQAALKPLGSAIGGAIGQVTPFADGGVVNSPVLFPMRGGAGLMGEAGPEAIMPLARGPDGKLGVRGGGGQVNVTVNIATPDAASFQSAQGQVAALVTRAALRGQRNL
jgi:phage-related minor tail protein